MQFSKWLELALIAAVTPQVLAQVPDAHDRHGALEARSVGDIKLSGRGLKVARTMEHLFDGSEPQSDGSESDEDEINRKAWAEAEKRRKEREARRAANRSPPRAQQRGRQRGKQRRDVEEDNTADLMARIWRAERLPSPHYDII